MAWYNANWDYRMKITVAHSYVDSDLVAFPLYIDLSDSGFSDLHDNCKSDGSDLVGTSSNGTTKLYRDLAFITPASDIGEIYINTDLSSSGATEIYIYYGYSSATETNDTETWNSNFILVSHFQETGSGSSVTISDSSQVGNDGSTGVGYSSSTTTDFPDQGNSFYNSSLGSNPCQYADISDYDVTDLSVTVAWRLDSTGFIGIVQRYQTTQDWTYHVTATELRVRFDDSTAFASSFTASADTWYRTALTFSDSNDRVRHYSAGSQLGSDVSCTKTFSASANRIEMGMEGGGDPLYGFWNEMRISSNELTAAWIAFEYDNFNDFANVTTIGSQETGLVLEQEGFRFRNDDGSESAATWKAVQDTDVSVFASQNFRLRALINATGDPDSSQYAIQYKLNGDGASEWSDVPLTI